jgi:hypothetical protein
MEKSSFHSPAAAMSRPRRRAQSSAQAEDAREDAELAAADAKSAQRRQSNEDKVAKLLGATYFVTDYAWPFLRYMGGALTVSRFYPEIKVAIDTFERITDHEKKMIEMKRTELNAHGIKYAWLDWTKQTSDIVPELEAQK